MSANWLIEDLHKENFQPDFLECPKSLSRISHLFVGHSEAFEIIIRWRIFHGEEIRLLEVSALLSAVNAEETLLPTGKAIRFDGQWKRLVKCFPFNASQRSLKRKLLTAEKLIAEVRWKQFLEIREKLNDNKVVCQFSS